MSLFIPAKKSSCVYQSTTRLGRNRIWVELWTIIFVQGLFVEEYNWFVVWSEWLRIFPPPKPPSKGLFTWRWGTPGRCCISLRWGNPTFHSISPFYLITFTLPTWGPPPSCKQALRLEKATPDLYFSNKRKMTIINGYCFSRSTILSLSHRSTD